MSNSKPSNIGPFVKRPVLQQDTYSVEEVAILLRISRNAVYGLSRRETDPLPLHAIAKTRRGLFAYRDELLAWSKRNVN